MKKLSSTQLEALIDIYYDRPSRGRANTIKSLERRGLLLRMDDGFEVSTAGRQIVEQTDFDEETGDLVEAAYYLGRQVVENPKLVSIVAIGAILGGLISRYSRR